MGVSRVSRVFISLSLSFGYPEFPLEEKCLENYHDGKSYKEKTHAWQNN